jgi:hypothetical protein
MLGVVAFNRLPGPDLDTKHKKSKEGMILYIYIGQGKPLWCPCIYQVSTFLFSLFIPQLLLGEVYSAAPK